MKNPNLIPAPFAQNGHRDEIPASYKSDLPSQKATWDTGFPQITMMPVTAGGLPPSGRDFNGVFNQISDNIVHLSQGGKYKFSQEYANSINGYPEGAILQSDDETKEFQSLIDNNKINFNTESADKINSAWKLVSTNQILDELNKKLNRSDVVQSIGSSQSTVMSQRAVTDELKNIKTPASITQQGIVQLNNAVDSNNETQAATPRAVKAANDLANTAIQNAADANNNANTRLEKEQNGADIPNKQVFVYNLGLTDTVDLAASAIPKSAITHYSGGSETLVMSQSITSQLISERIKKSDAELLAVPIGGILIWCSPLSYPNNFLPMEGGYIDRGKYPELLKHYPSGRLPDWRGYVPRGWDNERGVDNGRELGSFQDDAIRDITGIFRTGSRKEDGTPDRTNGAFSTLKAGNNIAVYGDSDRPNAYTYEDREFRASWVVPTASENRMKNVAVIFLIRGR